MESQIAERPGAAMAAGLVEGGLSAISVLLCIPSWQIESQATRSACQLCETRLGA